MKYLSIVWIITIIGMTACLEKTGSFIPEELIPNEETPQQEDSLNIIEHDIYFRSNRDGQYDIYKMNFDGENISRITESGGVVSFRITPDGTKLIYHRNSGSTKDIYIINGDGSGEKKLTDQLVSADYWDLSADSKKLAYSTGSSLYIMDLETGFSEVYQDTFFLNNLNWWRFPKFLPGGDEIVYLAQDYALKVLDLKTGLTRYICSRCIYEEHHFQVFSNNKKILIQMSQYGETYIYTIDPTTMISISGSPYCPELTPDGDGFVYVKLARGCPDSIMMHDLNTNAIRSIKSIAAENCAAFEGSNNDDFSFSPEGTVILWNSGKGYGETRITSDIFMIDIHGNNFHQLTDHPAEDKDAVFQNLPPDVTIIR
jgi:Tol biopolymer transport system component